MNFLQKSLLLWLLVAFGGAVMGQSMTAKDYFLLGSAKYKCRACDQAIAEFNKALELDKNYADAFYGRSLAHTCNKDYAAALQDIDRALRLKPTEVLYQECKARIKLESGKNLEAKAAYLVALRTDSMCWQAWYGLGMAERNIDSLQNATRAFERAIHIKPNFAMSYLGRAETQLKSGLYEEALADLKVAGALAPSYAKVFELRSSTYLKLQKYDDAISDATEALRLEPESSLAYYYRGQAYFEKKDFAKADLDFAEAIAHNKNDGSAWFKRAVCNDQLGIPKTALKYYGKAIKRNRGIADAYANRAALWESMEKPKKALPDLNNALALSPEDLALRIRRGFVHLSLDHIQLASDDFVQATRLDPASGMSFYGLGLARYQNGNVMGACEAWKQAALLGEQKASAQLAKYCNQ